MVDVMPVTVAEAAELVQSSSARRQPSMRTTRRSLSCNEEVFEFAEEEEEEEEESAAPSMPLVPSLPKSEPSPRWSLKRVANSP